MTRVKRTLLALIAIGALQACGPKDVIPAGPAHPANPEAPTGGGPAAQDRDAIAAAEQAAYERARPVFEKHCARCHTAGGAKSSQKKLDHFSMDSYPFGGHHAEDIGEEVREVLGATGEKPTMPMDDPGAVKGDELELVIAWSKAFDAAHAAGLHDHGGGGHDQHEGHGGGH